MDVGVISEPVVDPFLTLFTSFLTYLLVILGSIYIVWLFPIIKNGTASPSADTFIQWAISSSSFVHSTLMAIVGTRILSTETWSNQFFFETRVDVVPIFVTWEIGYQLSQTMFKCYLMIENNRSKRLRHLIGHILTIGILLWHERLGICDFFITLWFLTQWSTAFTHYRTLLSKSGKENTLPYFIVSILCPISFILCRFVPIGIVLYLNIVDSSENWMEAIPPIYAKLMIGFTLYNFVAFARMLERKSLRKRLKLA